MASIKLHRNKQTKKESLLSTPKAAIKQSPTLVGEASLSALAIIFEASTLWNQHKDCRPIVIQTVHLHDESHVDQLLGLAQQQQQLQENASGSTQHVIVAKVVWNVDYPNYKSIARIVPFLVHHCCVLQLDLVACTRRHHYACNNTNNHVFQQCLEALAAHPTLTSLALQGKGLDDASCSTVLLQPVCKGLRRRNTSTLRSITWEPMVSCDEKSQDLHHLRRRRRRRPCHTKQSFAWLVDTLCAIGWNGNNLKVSFSFDTSTWKDLVRLLTDPHANVRHIELNVSSTNRGMPACSPPATGLLDALEQSTSLETLLLRGTAVLECWNALPDHLPEILTRNRLLHHVQQLRKSPDNGELAWLISRLVELDQMDVVVATPLYALIRQHYVRPSHHG